MRDITLIASYPRSGNTWTRAMLACYLAEAPVYTRERLDDLVPDLHRLLPAGIILPPHDLKPAIVKTHFLPSAEVHQLYRPAVRKILYLVRNPRDIIFSYIRLAHIQGNHQRQFAKDFIANRGKTTIHKGLGAWPQHVLEWTALENVREYFPAISDIKIIKYEDLSEDPALHLQQIVEFLDLDDKIEPDRIRMAIENSSLEKMRAGEDIERRSGVNAYHDKPAPARFIHQGLQGQSLGTLGYDVEAAYQKLLRDDDEFSCCAKNFGYTS